MTLSGTYTLDAKITRRIKSSDPRVMCKSSKSSKKLPLVRSIWVESEKYFQNLVQRHQKPINDSHFQLFHFNPLPSPGAHWRRHQCSSGTIVTCVISKLRAYGN